MIQKPAYFPGLDALRFYAALSVVIAHTATNFAELRTTAASYPVLDWLILDAQSAVTLFFVLSGFLITYLLLKEYRAAHTVNVRRFYIRRMLRIWPVYYLVVIVGFVVFPLLLGSDYPLFSPSASQIILVLFLLANFARGMGPLGHLWTIAMEEQFYLVWPWIMKRRGRLVKVALGIIFIKLAIIVAALALQNDSMMLRARGFRFECMAYGALGAYLYFYNHNLLRLIYSRAAQALALVGMVALILWDIPYTAANNQIVSVICIVFILNLATNPHFWLKFNFLLLNRLGQISYGMYMYHFPLLYASLSAFRAWEVPPGHTYNLGLYVLTLGSTLLISAISYRWFETPFLNLKERFTAMENPSPIPESSVSASR